MTRRPHRKTVGDKPAGRPESRPTLRDVLGVEATGNRSFIKIPSVACQRATVDYCLDYGLTLSRGFKAFTIWCTLQIFGLDALLAAVTEKRRPYQRISGTSYGAIGSTKGRRKIALS
jgi:hypothetical protein